MSLSTLTEADMQAAITAGDATPLLPEGVPGPVHHDHAWWVIPRGEQSYQRVTDATTSAALDEHAARLAAGARAVQRTDIGEQQ